MNSNDNNDMIGSEGGESSRGRGSPRDQHVICRLLLLALMLFMCSFKLCVLHFLVFLAAPVISIIRNARSTYLLLLPPVRPPL